MSTSEFPYTFRYGEPGLFLEVYVPTSFEPRVREALEKGMDDRFLKQYLRNPDFRNEIAQLLAEDATLRDPANWRLDRLQSIIQGFSIYRGDGAFLGDKLERDQVSVVRLMFLPPLSTWFDSDRVSDARRIARRFLHFWTHSKDEYLHAGRQQGATVIEPFESSVIDKLVDWLDDISLVINGYVMHQLSRESIWRRQMGLASRLESEFWVGSFRTLAVTKVQAR
jgi:hypothetical protein